MPISAATFKQLALEDDDRAWELRCGQLVEKPGMTMEHNQVAQDLMLQVAGQLDRERFVMRSNAGHIEIAADRYVIPDIAVIPVEYIQARQGQPDRLESYDEALPWVVEVWSRSTGAFDVESKLPWYRERGDHEIWLVHPYDRTVAAWRREPNASYSQHFYSGGRVPVESLPGVTVDLDELFRW